MLEHLAVILVRILASIYFGEPLQSILPQVAHSGHLAIGMKVPLPGSPKIPAYNPDVYDAPAGARSRRLGRSKLCVIPATPAEAMAPPISTCD